MTSKFLNRSAGLWLHLALVAAMMMAVPHLGAQTASRYLGTISAIAGDTITVKTDAGETHQVQVGSTASLKRIAPGQKDLSTAESIQFSDLAMGDRVLVKIDPAATGATPQALQVIAIKQADVALKQQKEREEWQRNGAGGLVKSVDAGAGVVVVTSGAGATAKTVTVHISKTTVLKRYAPGSVSFDDAQPAPVDAIQAGDQLRARGQKNGDGTEISAEEVVSGSFRNISGTILSIDAAGSTLTVKDLVTKKPVTIHIATQSQMHRLPDMMAKMITARLKGTTAAPAAGQATPGGASPMPGAGQGRAPSGMPPGGGPVGSGQWQGRPGGGAGGSGDMQQMLSRAPVIHLSDLQKGEAVMLVSTQGTTEVTAITLLAGVEPLLEAPEASQSLLSNWSMGSGGGAEAASQ